MASSYLIYVAYGMLDLMNILSVVVVSLLDALLLVLVPVRSKTSHKFVKRAVTEYSTIYHLGVSKADSVNVSS